jgi:catechol 2,3-dioxygenase-like lactoylglutathione lyase family enzyme
MPRFLGTRHILAVHDLRLSTKFFVEVLGFERDFGDGSDGWSWLGRDDVHVGLGECPEAQPASSLGDHSYFAYITVDDVDALYADLVSRGAPVKVPPATKPWGMREIAVSTPDGHRMTFGSESPAT